MPRAPRAGQATADGPHAVGHGQVFDGLSQGCGAVFGSAQTAAAFRS